MIPPDSTPKRTKPQIETLYIAVANAFDDPVEGLCNVFMDGTWVPLMCFEEKDLHHIRDLSQKLAFGTGRVVKILKFTDRDVIATYDRRN
jgi:hypothetical protein